MKTLKEIVNEQKLKRYEETLKYIADFMSPEEFRDDDFTGLGYEETLEMAYENIIFAAMQALNREF